FNPDLKHPLAAMQQLLQMQKNGVRVKPQDLRPSLPDEAQVVIMKALCFTPADRYQRADEFGKALAEALTAHDEDRLTTQYIDKGTEVMTDPAVEPVSKPEQQTRLDRGRKTNVGRVALKSEQAPSLEAEKAVQVESKPDAPKPPSTRIIKIAATIIGT